jgi:hypothetical protein
VVALPVSIKDRISWAPATSIDYVPSHMGHMESPNLVALTVTELDDTLPRFTDD